MPTFSSSRGVFHILPVFRRIAYLGLLLLPILVGALSGRADDPPAFSPPWWWPAGLGPGNDFEAVNAGQLKHMASRARLAMEASLTGGAGTEVTTMVVAFSNTDNYQAVNAGQLKYVAKILYPRLTAAGVEGAPPSWWAAALTNTDNYATVNAGQLKNVFNFTLPYTAGGDADGDGMSNAWEIQHGLDLLNAADAAGDLDGDGLSCVLEYLLGTNPSQAAIPDPGGEGGINLIILTPQ